MIKASRLALTLGLSLLCAVGTALPAVVMPSTTYAAVQSVTVDLSQTLGAPTNRATGFLYGLSENGTAPAGALLTDIKPKLFRGGGAGLSGGAWAVGGYNGYLPRFNSVLAQYNRANAIGAKYQILVSDVWGSDGRTIPDNNQPIFPGDNGSWTSWTNFLTQLVNDKKANNMTNARYDIWNEPDGDYFWPRSDAQYSEMWKRSVQTIRSLDPNAVIVGPGYGGFNATQLGNWLDYAKTNNVLPDILDWHFSADPVADVQTAQGLLAARNITSISGMTIGEYIWSAEQNAGYTAWYIARLEKSGVLGANHAIWDHCCDQGMLDDILTTNGQKKGQWWTYKSYADMSGSLVATTPSANIDGVASKDATKHSALILLGNKGGVTGDIDVNVNRFDTASYLIGSNGKAHVVVTWINNLDPVSAPTVTQTFDATVVNNAIKVTIPWNYSLDAYSIAITPSDGSQQPTSSVYEAENATLSGGAKVMTDHTGYTGTGFVAGYEFQGPSTQFAVSAASGGNYGVELRYANGSGAAKALSVYVNGVKIKQTSVPATANWDTWGTKTETLSLQSGGNTIAYKFESGDSGPVNLDKITLYAPQTPTSSAIPGKIEAESYSGMFGIQTETTSDTGGGMNVGWIDANDWMDYGVNVQATGAYTASFRVASPNSGGQLQLRDSTGSALATITVPNTGGWQTWTTVNATISLPAGNQILRLYVVTGGFNVNWVDYAASTAPPTFVYQAETATLSGGAKAMNDHSGYTGTGFVAGYEPQGASTQFAVNASAQGNYAVELRYANGSGTARTLSIYVNGTKIKQTTLASTANWDTWGLKTETLSLQSGNNTIAYKFDAGDNGLVNLDKITLTGP
ncbi:carbohydrate-binding protein [Cohnella yongneupensis]|uniref:Carbohydrate-binding protein n=1 Tax=Cohnella yongneupensis TaxID=425006 RepID=A0ABW0QZK9_9BACL